MSDYEFWKELGKIFNAVVSYQEKSIEFNKRFINPWISIGNVFDQQNHQREEVRAYRQAAEIDPCNAQNWIELGNAHYRNQAYEEAVMAFHKAIELDSKLGWAYSNLALVYAEQNKHVEAKALYEKSVNLLTEDRDKAITWNRLGNLHRKLNEYELAIRAFQKADELDRENAGFKDVMSEAMTQKQKADEFKQTESIATSIRLIVAQSESDDDLQNPKEIPANAQSEDVFPSAEMVTLSAKQEPATVAEPPSENVDQLEPESMPAIDVANGVAGASMEASLPTETYVNETVLLQVETYTAELTSEQSADVKIFDATSVIAVAQETFTAAPSTEIGTLDKSEEITDALGSDETVEEPSADGTEEEVVLEVADTVEHCVDMATLVSTMEADVASAPVAESEDLAKPVSEAAEPVMTTTAEEPSPAIADPVEMTQMIVEVAEPVVPVAAEDLVGKIEMPVAVSETVVEISEPVTAVATESAEQIEPVAETIEPVAETVAEETPQAIADVVEPVAPVAMEEPVAEGAGCEKPEIEMAKFVQPVAMEAMEETLEEVIKFAAPADETPNMEAAEIKDSSEAYPILPQPAYEEFLKNEGHSLVQTPREAIAQEVESQGRPVALVDESGDFQLELDAKNAHVWNELGNVYFNRGAIEDAIVAYSKAIELDRWFAWPYSNLALAYVQKGRFTEAMLLYQRSIELFTEDKDKAISWNRLGNVYRRLNDYDNAIAAYQRADELDPGNSTIYLQSRFSLLGSFQMNQNSNVNI